jgi:rhodanese-related sulfurtransferase
MKYKTIFQVAIIAAVSLGAAVIYNALSPDGLPLFNKYDIKSINRKLAVRYETASTVKYIDTGAVLNLLENDMAVMIDTRDNEAFSAGHIPGAINLQPADFDNDYERIAKFLSTGKVIAIYGRDANDSNCGVIAWKLTKRTRTNLFIYKGGMADWIKQGNKIESADNNTAGNNDLEK